MGREPLGLTKRGVSCGGRTLQARKIQMLEDKQGSLKEERYLEKNEIFCKNMVQNQILKKKAMAGRKALV